MQKKNNPDTYQTYLRFDNLNFKLAVLQHLIYEKKVFAPVFDFEEFDFEAIYEGDLSQEECDEALERHVQDVLYFFTYLKVPAELAKYVTELKISVTDEFYSEISPEWSFEDDLFYVNKISDREVAQFPKLRKITFWYMSDRVEELRQQLKKHRIKVELGGKDNGKRISPAVAIMCMLIVTVVVGGGTGIIFSNYYGDDEVTWSSSSVEEIDVFEMEESEDWLKYDDQSEEQYEFDVDKVLEESQKRMEDHLKDIQGEIKLTPGEEANE